MNSKENFSECLIRLIRLCIAVVVLVGSGSARNLYFSWGFLKNLCIHLFFAKVLIGNRKITNQKQVTKRSSQASASTLKEVSNQCNISYQQLTNH
jgi:hypothetical protein